MTDFQLNDLYPQQEDQNGFSRAFALLQLAKEKTKPQEMDFLDSISQLEKAVLNAREAGADAIALSETVDKMNEEDWGGAAELLKQLVKRRPRFAKAFYYLTICFTHLKQFGNAAKAIGLAEEACEDDELAEQLSGLKKQLAMAPVNDLLKAASDKMNAGKFRGAIPMLRKVVRKAPDIYLGHYLLGVCLAKESSPREAKRCLSKAMQFAETEQERKTVSELAERVDEMQVAAKVNQAIEQMNREDFRGALPALQEAVSKVPKLFAPRYYLAICYLKTDSMNRAERAAKEALKRAGSSQERKQAQDLVSAISQAINAKGLNELIEEAVEKSKKLVEKGKYGEARKVIRKLPSTPSELRDLKNRLLGQIEEVERSSKNALSECSRIMDRLSSRGVDISKIMEVARDNNIDISNPLQYLGLLKAIEEQLPGRY